ncbi:MAG: beta-lactamase family protein [Candidatus Eisenbacteria bacterium]|nr:beta-lactamase family protein [Candidatus Eisenbacteria bacterium]
MRGICLTLGCLALGCLAAWAALSPPAGANEASVLETSFVGPSAGERLDLYFESKVPLGFSGVVLVYKDGLIVLHEAYGSADRSTGAPNTVQTLFPIGGMSRQFALAAVLRLAHEGKLDLSRRVDALLPGDIVDGADRTIAELIARADVESGRLLEAIVETASGTSYEEYLRERIFRKAGMTSTTFAHRLARDGEGIARGHEGPHALLEAMGRSSTLRPFLSMLDSSLRRAAIRLRPAEASAAGADGLGMREIATTAADLFRWELALRGGEILPAESKHLLFGVPRGAESRWFLPFQISGDSPGYQTGLLRRGDRDVVIVILQNTDIGWRRALEAGVEGALFGGTETGLNLVIALIAVAVSIWLFLATLRTRRSRRRRRPRLGPLLP